MITSPFWALGCLSAGWLTAYLLRHAPHPSCFHNGRHQNLDGLRGVIALIVFICHASTWQQYLSDQRWRISETSFYILPGQTGIVIFFMLTGFLFTQKFLLSNSRSENWIRLYISRAMRLVPAYFLMLIFLTGVIAYQLAIGNIRLANCNWRDAMAWLAFTMPGAPNLCGYGKTNIAISGVTWSLTYEWIFYLSLPLLALISRKRVSLLTLLTSIIVVFACLRAVPWYSVVYLSFFLGIASAFVDFYRPSPSLQNSSWAGAAAMTLLIVNSVLHPQTSYTVSSVLIIGLAFHVFASGNTLLGILNTREFQIFGLCTYSLYLFHGLLLYTALSIATYFFPLFHTINFIYWPVIVLLTPILIAGTLSIYLRLEHPAMQRTPKMAAVAELLFIRGHHAITSFIGPRIK